MGAEVQLVNRRADGTLVPGPHKVEAPDNSLRTRRLRAGLLGLPLHRRSRLRPSQVANRGRGVGYISKDVASSRQSRSGTTEGATNMSEPSLYSDLKEP